MASVWRFCSASTSQSASLRHGSLSAAIGGTTRTHKHAVRGIHHAAHTGSSNASNSLLCAPCRASSRLRRPVMHAYQRRTFFGIGEIVGVLSNPAEVVRNMTESKRLLEEARQDLKEMKERSQLPPKHTFAPLPGFFERNKEIQAIERTLSGVPTFNVLFGASSVGKTALCRQILCKPIYHVLHYDLRIAGFADLASLYYALSTQMEQYFVEISKKLPGYEDFEKESYTFKHDRLALEKRVEAGGEVKTSDIAKTMELFQSALLKYWSFEPALKSDSEDVADKPATKKDEKSLKRARTVTSDTSSSSEPVISSSDSPTPAPRTGATETEQSQSNEAVPPKKLIPVIFFDEAHRLPLLIKDKKAMKCILDAMLVLTKQDRLIHVIHATSDPFYLHWLRQLNIMQHCKVMSIGDASKGEAQRYFIENLLPDVPENLRARLKFDELFEVFGGKLAHLADYVADFVNADGHLTPYKSSHYAQAHALLNLQLIHSFAPPGAGGAEAQGQAQASGFAIYSPLQPGGNDEGNPEVGTDFTPGNLIEVCKRLLAENSLSYFTLCREMGARAVDGLIRGRILELRWVETITPEYEIEQSIMDTGPLLLPTTPVIRAAMKQVVEEWKDYKEEPAQEAQPN